MSKEIKLRIQVIMILLQFYVGGVLLLTPERAHLGHYIVVLFVSVPILVGVVRERRK